MNAILPKFSGLRELFSMIVVMERRATPDQIQHMVKRVESLGLKSHVIHGTERTVIAAIGEKRSETKEALASGPGVEDVVPILAPYKVASREVKERADVYQVVAGSLKVGAGAVGIIAGPCSVESEEQILKTAHAVKERRGHRPPRRRVQAADESLQFPRHEGRRAQALGSGPRTNGARRRHRGDEH
jgi:hypothetical protein